MGRHEGKRILGVFKAYKRQKLGEGPQFELRAKNRDRLFCLAPRSSPMVKLLVKVADMVAINRHNRHNDISHETCAIFVFDLAAKTARARTPLE